MFKPPRPRYGLRLLLLLPVLVAAFYGGWTSHEKHAQRRFENQAAEAHDRREALLREIEFNRLRNADRLRQTIDRVEQQKRLKTFRSLRVDPFKVHMSPHGSY